MINLLAQPIEAVDETMLTQLCTKNYHMQARQLGLRGVMDDFAFTWEHFHMGATCDSQALAKRNPQTDRLKVLNVYIYVGETTERAENG
jgi:hypothetical protein